MSSRARCAEAPVWKYALAGIASVICGALLYVALHVQYAINTSASLNGALYVVFDHWPKRAGAIAVFSPPEGFDPETPFLKRIAGVPGDVVEVDEKARIVSVNGKRIGWAKPATDAGDRLDMIAPGVIPEGQYFMAGDNDESFDSRFAWVGLIGEERIAAVGFEAPFITREMIFDE